MSIRKPYPNELYHHGIMGQKWGVRRFQNPNGSLTPAGRKRYLKGTGARRSESSDNVDKAMLPTPLFAIYGTWLAIIVGHAVADKAAKHAADKFVDKCEEERNAAKIDKSTGLKRKTTNLSEKEDIKRVNPQYNVDKHDPHSDGATSNCVNCTMALEMRKRGFEVQAKIRDEGRAGLDVGKKYFNTKTITVRKAPKYSKNDMDEFHRFYNREEKKARRQANKELAQETIDSIKSNSPIGARGQICVRWDRYCGHSMMYDVTENGVRLLDGQTGKIYNEKAANKLLRSCCTAEYQRFDNCKVNYKAIKEAVR